MAIRLASAVGQQRTPVDMYGGIGDAINKTGDAIQADMLRKQEAEAKKAKQDQDYKDLIAATLKTRSLDKVRTEDWEEDQKFQKEGMADILLSSKDPNITKSQLDQKQRDYIEGLQKREHLYKRDYDSISSVAKKQDTHDTSLFDNFLIGKTNPTQVANMPNDDFMAASEADRAGKMVGENGMQATETQTSYQGKPYFSQSIDERLKTDIKAKENELTALKKPNIVKAAQGYLGSDFKFGSLTKRTDKVSPTSGEYIYEFDEKGADELAKKFASSVVGDGNFGSKEHSQYQRALEYEALRAGNEAGFSGDKLKEFVEEVVPRMAYDDFMKDARSAEAERSKNEKDITKQPSKGFSINNNLGGGASETIDGVFIPKEGKFISEAVQKKHDNVISSAKERIDDIKKKISVLERKKEDKEYMNNPSAIAEFDKSIDAHKKNIELENKNISDLQKNQEEEKSKKGLTSVSFTPKGQNNWFSATTTDGKLRKIIPSEIRVDDNGNVVEVLGYNLNESTTEKQDLEVFTVDATNEDNKNNFFGKYPTSLKGVKDVTGIDIKAGKVVVEGKAGVGAVNQPKKEAAKVEPKKENLDKAAELINKYRKKQ